jgi:hypothetical protein
VLLYETAFGGRLNWETPVKEELRLLSTMNPSSAGFWLLSIQARLTCAGEMAVAVSELGAPTGAATRAGAANPENRIAVKIVLRVRPTSLNLPYRLSGAETFLDDVTESVLGSCGVRTSG